MELRMQVEIQSCLGQIMSWMGRADEAILEVTIVL